MYEYHIQNWQMYVMFSCTQDDYGFQVKSEISLVRIGTI